MPFWLWWVFLGLFVVLCYYGEREARRGRPHAWVLSILVVCALIVAVPFLA